MPTKYVRVKDYLWPNWRKWGQIVLYSVTLYSYASIFIFKNVALYRDYHETYHYLYVNSPQDIFPQQYGHNHLIEND